ncbi:von Willebrand factor type A domain-containing protein [Rhodopirellula sp. SWK7]|uniref:YfbK domain-containing protein n=1 Tax=Rhodopirellula sp. SWK7 TaxID=595460 RepID=UPI0002BE77AA|nr:von Willebrand factor type A domain-containing protein [Rhodopirellula sp. SWK7]EMI41086.1 von Willebrand factor type A domain-containing protein [Rhodopirellula sp. SWK7]
MSSEQNLRPDESSGGSSTWDDERITAYVMGELSPEETAAFETEMKGNEELVAAVEEASKITEKLAGFYASIPTTTLDADRREQIVGAASAQTHRASASQGSSKRYALWAVAASVLFIGLALPAMMSRPGVQTAMMKDASPESSSLASEEVVMEDDSVKPVAAAAPISERVASDEKSSAMSALSVSSDEVAPAANPRPTGFAASDRASRSGRVGAAKSSGRGMGMEMEGMDMSGPALMGTDGDQMDMAMDMDMGGMGISSDSAMSMGMDMDAPTPDPSMSMSFSAPSSSPADAKPFGEARRSVVGDQDEPAMGPAMAAVLEAPVTMEEKEVAQNEFRPHLSKNPLVKAQPVQPAAPVQLAAPASGDVRGGYGLPTDTSGLRGRADASKRGAPVAEMVPDLLSIVEGTAPGEAMLGQGTGPGTSGDKFAPITENEFRRVSEHPLSTLSIDVDTASYSKVRSYLQRNQLPRPDSVRIEEMVNYFDYDYTGPSSMDGEASDPFAAAMTTTVCPWEPKHRLVRVGLQAKTLTKQERPRCNLVFLLDTSGSMSSANKLPLVIDGMKVLLEELDEEDRVAIVVYAGSAGLVLDSTPVKNRKKILRALTQLRSGGSTNGGAGLQLAYDTAREHMIKDGVNRVILCSDGDFNVGMTGTDQLVREARRQAKSGVDLTVLGFGMGNHNDAMMEKISNDAEGNYAFVDTIGEARKVLADQLTGTLVTVAKDVKIQIEFNPAVVSSYRLIGYENRLLAKEDFNDDTKDAGEIGAGHRVTAFYEVVPAGTLPAAVAPAVDPLKYQPERNQPQPESDRESEEDAAEQASEVVSSTEMLTLKLRYKPPQGDTSTLMTRVLDDSKSPFDQADVDFRFAASVAAFGMLLRGSEFSGSWTYEDVLRTAEDATGEDPHGLRREMIEMTQTARRLTVAE